MELVFALIAICALLTSGAFAKSKNKHNIQVRSHLPGYIEFDFPLDDFLQPQSLSATLNDSNKIITFTRTQNSYQIKFRNTEEQHFEFSDSLKCSLFYKLGTELSTNSISFFHTINEKPKNLSLNISRSPKKLPKDEDNVADAGRDGSLTNAANSVNSKTDANFMPPNAEDSVSHTELSCTDLREVLNTILKHVDIRKRLLLTGLKTLDTNAVDVLRNIIAEKLKLKHLQHKILQAKFEGENILFEMSSGEDVLQILTQMRLINSIPQLFDIVMTDLNFFKELTVNSVSSN